MPVSQFIKLATLALFLAILNLPDQTTATAVFMPDPTCIVAFWPMDKRHGFTDISGLRRPASAHRGIINKAQPGPFGLNATSMTVNVTRGQGYLFESRFRGPSPSFSISFAFFAGESDVGILTTATSCKGLSFYYSAADPPALILSKGNFPATLIAKFAVFRKHVWNFMTITFDSLTHQMIVYGREGMLTYSPFEPQISQTSLFDSGMLVGFSCYNGHTNFKPDAALSCLAVHDRVLTLPESKQVFEACRLLHLRAATDNPEEAEAMAMDSLMHAKSP